MNYSKLIPVEQHFHSNGHNVNFGDTNFIIIEKIEKDLNIKSLIEKKSLMNK